MKTIPLTQGKVALVDNVDYEWLSQWEWYAIQGSRTFYAGHGITSIKCRRTLELMHRLILGLQPGDKRVVDHRDSNGLNNQRANLRACTRAQNRQSSRKIERQSTSRYKGVYPHYNNHQWHSQIRVNGKQIYLGLFNSEIEAARAYDVTALKYYSEFALTNKMLGLL